MNGGRKVNDEPTSDPYDLADEPAVPAPRATPVVPVPYATPASVVPVETATVEAQFPDRRRDLWWPLALASLGTVALFTPAVAEGSTVIAMTMGLYLVCKFLAMVGLCIGLGHLVRLPFGTWGSFAIKILAVVTVTDGTVCLAFVSLTNSCFAVVPAIAGSIAACTLSLWYLFELEPEEVALTAAVYWFPSAISGTALLFFCFRAANWFA